MEAYIEKLEEATDLDDRAGIRVTVVVFKCLDYQEKPREEEFIVDWMKVSGREKDLEHARASLNSAIECWKTSGALRRAQNNAIEALRLGNCTLLQDPFHPEEAPK
jgi:hypothetical protein